MNILMVCLGNICRSPLAQGILEAKIAENGLAWTVDSAGTGSWHAGDPPDPRSVAIARKYGLDISGQRARQVRSVDFEAFDLIVAMDASNYNDLQRMAIDETEKAKIKMMLNFTEPGKNRGVPDPYWDDDGFDKVYHMLDEACEHLIRAVIGTESQG
jgi:protein-tyrosine phosphatase